VNVIIMRYLIYKRGGQTNLLRPLTEKSAAATGTMAFVRSILLACAVASSAAFAPAVGAFGRVGSLRKGVSYTPAAASTRAAPKTSSRRAAAASNIAMGYNVDLTGKVAVPCALAPAPHLCCSLRSLF